MQDRGSLDETLANMFSNPTYAGTYLFYAHMIGQCSIKIDRNLPASAGVAFNIDHYDLYINPEEFDKFTLEQRLGILKHEMLHILNNHIGRLGDRSPLPWNYATDCAINQLIDRNHLPKITQEDIDKFMQNPEAVAFGKKLPNVGDSACIFPDTFPVKAEKNKHAEWYYELLKKEAEDQEDGDQDCSQCGGSGRMDKPENDKSEDGNGESEDGNGESEDGNGESEDGNGESEDGKCSCDRCGGSGKDAGDGYGQGSGKLVDDHGTWNKSTGDKDLQKDLTKNMIERSIGETQKARGNLPENISEMLAIFTRQVQVNWRQVLRGIVGNKRVNTKSTVMRKNRRLPNRPDLRGKTKDRIFELVVLVDVSGSMSTNEIMVGLNEIHEICKLTKTTMKMIQIDTQVHKVEEFSVKTKLFERAGCGGTIMEAGVQYLFEENITHDAIIYITDGYIEDVSQWSKQPNCRVMWLCTSDGVEIPGVDKMRQHRQYPLKL